jgi:hypothetical protein
MSATTFETIGTSWTLPIGSGADIAVTHNIPGGCKMLLSGALSWDGALLSRTLAAYAFEIWQATAARELADTVDNSQTFSNVQTVTVSGGDLRQLFLEFDAPPKAGYRIGDTDTSYDIGYCQFQYGTHYGPMQHINWKKSKLVPEFPRCTGALLNFREPMSGTVIKYYYAGGLPRLRTIDGALMSPSSKNLLGCYDTVGGADDNTITQVDSMSVACIDSGDVSTFTQPSLPWAFNVLNLQGSFQENVVPVAYACEAWQSTAVRDFGDSTATKTVLGGDHVYVPDKSWAKAFSLDLSGPAHPADKYWRYPPLQNYGCWAPVYGNFFGPTRPINALASFMMPEGDSCNGVWIFLKKGYTGSLVMQQTQYRVIGTETPNGPVRLREGTTDGLTYGL